MENKKGSLHEISDILAKNNIDLRSMCIADTADYGIVRIIADDPAKALAILQASGHAANVREVTAFAVPDCPGGLAKVLSLLEANGVNIEYMYALVTSEVGKAYAVLRSDDTITTDEILTKSGIELLDEANLH